jgi:hypothetical protein
MVTVDAEAKSFRLFELTQELCGTEVGGALDPWVEAVIDD